jgi:Tol biopolymer transport system component
MSRPLAPEDLFRFRFVVGADLSPDATRVVFAQTRVQPGETEEDGDVEHCDLYLLDVETGATRRLTFSDSTNSAPAISPDSSRVAFTSTRTEKAQLWLLPLDGGEPRLLTDLPQASVAALSGRPMDKGLPLRRGRRESHGIRTIPIA